MGDIGEAMLLRVCVDEADRCEGRPLYEMIVAKALECGMDGATVLVVPEGYGHSRHLHHELNPEAGPRLALMIEIVDSNQRVDCFLPALDAMMETGLATLERVIWYRTGTSTLRAGAAPSPVT